MEQHVTQINGGIKKNVDVSAKSIIYVKMITSIIDDSVITCDDTIEEETKIVQKILMKKSSR